MCRRPGDPVDGLASDDLQVRIDAHPIRKQDQVVAAPPCARRDKPVTAQELDGRADLLRAWHVDTAVSAFGYAERLKVGSDQLQRAVGRHTQRVQHHGLGGARSELAPMERNLGQRTFACQAGVEHTGAVASHPTAAAVRAGQRIKALPRAPENFTVEGLLRERVQPVYQVRVVDHPAVRASQMYAVEQLVD